jgi:hypothetical protein
MQVKAVTNEQYLLGVCTEVFLITGYPVIKITDGIKGACNSSVTIRCRFFWPTVFKK